MAAFFTQLRQDFLCFIWTDKIVRQNPLYRLYAALNDLIIIGAAILPQKKLKHIDRYISTFLDFLRQILPDNLPVKILPQLILYDFSGTQTLIHFIHSDSSHLRLSAKEIIFVYRKGDVNLELLTLWDLQS